MRRGLGIQVAVLIHAAAASAAPFWDGIIPYTIGRYTIMLPAGAGWGQREGVTESGETWYNVSGVVEVAGQRVFAWVGFETGRIPEQFGDWTEEEISRDILDFWAVSLMRDAEIEGRSFDVLEYGEEQFAFGVGHQLTWSWNVYAEHLKREVLQYQVLTVILPPDFAKDRSFMMAYLATICLTECKEGAVTTDFLRPLLATVEIGPAE